MSGVRSPEFVGRRVEQQWLREALARPGTRLVVIEGEAGIGKSRFIQETVPAGPGGVLLLRCPPIDAPFPLGTMVEALGRRTPDPGRFGRLAGALRPIFPEWSELLPAALPPAEGAAAERHRIFRALDELLRTLAVHTVVVDDAHWADGTTHDFLLHLATVAVDDPVRVVETWRTEERPPPSGVVRIASGGSGRLIRLGPLDLASTERFVASMLPGPVGTPRVAGLLHRRTQGVPLLLEDLIRTLHDRARADPGEDHWGAASIGSLAPPAGLRESVTSRTDRITPAARLVAWALAVLAEPASLPLLAAVTGLDHSAAGAAVDELVAEHLLTLMPTGEIAFRHALLLDVVAEQVPLGERSRLHAAAATALGALPVPPVVRLARHLKQSGDLAGWARHAEQVADLAWRHADDLTAADILLELATTTRQRPADLTRIVAKIPFPAFRDTSPFRAVGEVLRAAAGDPALSPLEQGRLRWQLARVLIMADQLSEAAEETERAVPLLAGEPLLAAQAMISLVHLSWRRWSAPTRQEWLRRATELLRDREDAAGLLRDPRLVSDLATVLLRFGSPAGWSEAAKLPSRDIKVKDRLTIAYALGNVAHCALIWGRHPTVRASLAPALELADTYDYPHLSAGLKAMGLHLDYREGAWTGLRQRAAELNASAQAVAGERLQAEIVEARLAAAEGDTAAAERQLRAVLAHPASRLGLELVMDASAVLAGIALARGAAEEALAVTEEPFSLITRTGVWLWGVDLVPVRVRALLLTGRVDAVREIVGAMAAGVAGIGAPAADAALLSCRALLAGAEGEPARELHRAAADAWGALPRPYDQGKDLEAAAGSEAELREIQRRYARLGAVADAERIAERLPGRRGGRTGYGGQLSPREREVVRLIAAGGTDVDIAAALFKSLNTVRSQVKSAKRKLGVTTRAELARAAADLPPEEPES